MPRKTLAVWFILLGLALGLLGNLFFYQQVIGLSLPLFLGLLMVVMLAASRPAQTPVNWRNLWLLGPLLFFAAMIAVYTNPLTTLLNIGAIMALGALGLHYMALNRPLDEATLPEQVGAVLQAGIVTPFATFPEIGDGWGWLRERSWQSKTLVAVARGLMIGVPVVVVFAVLLGSADVVFADYVTAAWNLFAFNPDVRLVDQAFLTLAIGWLSTGALAYGLARRSTPNRRTVGDDDSEEAEAYFVHGDDDALPMESVEIDAPPKRKAGVGFRLGMIESGIVLGLVDLLFAVFVLVQFRYFFGGETTISASGLTYAEYARRGFFELVAVSVMTLGLVLWLDYVTIRREKRGNRLFTALSMILVALTTVMLVSASQRMYLYEEAFGFTHLRVLVHVFILWLGVLFGVFLLSMFRLKKSIFAFGVLLVSIGYLGTLNVMNIDLYIAEHNIARFREGYALDLRFLGELSADAAPAVVTLYMENENNPEAQAWAGQWLARELRKLDNQQASNSLFSFNLARAQAWNLLDSLRDDLPAYDPYIFWSNGAYDIYAEDPPASR